MGALLAGCNQLINPWVDDLPATGDITTASVVAARSAQATPTPPLRQPEPMITSAQDGTVSHWPLWWEDPFEDKGSEDGQFAWTWEDYFAFPYGFGRFLLNTMAFPVSATVTPVWTVMGSDGVLSRQALGYDHDAAPLPGGIPPPIDILEVGADPSQTSEQSSEQIQGDEPDSP
jgi:hypothetical protein